MPRRRATPDDAPLRAITSRRREYQPSDDERRTVMVLAACGMTEQQIAINFNLTIGALRKHFQKEIDEGFARSLGFVVTKFWSLIETGDKNAIFYFLSRRAGWKDTANLTFGDDEDGALVLKIEDDDKPPDPESP